MAWGAAGEGSGGYTYSQGAYLKTGPPRAYRGVGGSSYDDRRERRLEMESERNEEARRERRERRSGGTPAQQSQKAYEQATAALKQQAQGVQTAAQQAARSADFFSPERGRYIQGLRQLMTGGKSAIAADPSYQFRLKQGQASLEGSLAAQGLLGSGRAGLELQRYGQEAASQEFQAQYQRLYQLAGVAQSDPSAAAQLRFQGAQAPFQAQQSIAGMQAQMLEGERGRGFEQSMAGLKHQQQLELLQASSEMGGGVGSRGVSGGGGGGGPLSAETLASLVPYDFSKMRNVGYGGQVAAERAKYQERAIFGSGGRSAVSGPRSSYGTFGGK